MLGTSRNYESRRTREFLHSVNPSKLLGDSALFSKAYNPLKDPETKFVSQP